MREIRNILTTGLLMLATVILLPDVSSAESYVSNEMVCRVTDFAYLDSINNRYGTQVTGFIPAIGSYLLETPAGEDSDSLAAVITADLGPAIITYCHANYILNAPEPVQGSQPFIDFDLQGDFEGQFATRQLSLASAQSVSTGQGVLVGIIDGGIDDGHPLFSTTNVSGYDYVDDDFDPDDVGGGSATGHGTFVAGIVKLVAPDADIAAYRVLDTSGRSDGFTIAQALVSGVFDGCRVINLSVVMDGNHAAIEDALAFAREQHTVVVSAAGNDSSEVARYPARDTNAISVTAVDSVKVKADFSNYHQTVTVSAPGVDIYGPYPDSSYAWWSGTSFAAPFVSGQAALLISANPAARWDEVVDTIVATAENIDHINPDYAGKLGAGLAHPARALGQSGPICGDVNGDLSGPDIADVSALVDFLFVTHAVPAGIDVADVNGSLEVDIADLTRLVNHLFINAVELNCL